MSVRKLSKNVLGMKFMKKKREEENMDEADSARIEDEEHWYLEERHSTSPTGTKIEEGVSVVTCENLSPCGRRSFRGFNSSVEKFYNEITAKKETYVDSDDVEENEAVVSNEEMAKRFGSLVQTVDKKFSRKRKNRHPIEEQEGFLEKTVSNNTKPKFLKPADD
ncbi:M-phase phosphoprotein 6-like [Oscarella lobularis]|uniref:M-phase phosphoprotein 6-like n=1 Tax=Oscarella lobularis TaxID=121494 RepID=UPI00331439AB